MSARQTISLAHTAECKLQIAADKPDRNLRFILGHAFTLDKLRLRVLEIESGSSGSDDGEGIPELTADRPRRVSFPNNAKAHSASNAKNRSPPPSAEAQHESSSEEEDFDDEAEDNEEDEGLGLRRFGSATVKPPRMIEDEDSSDEEADEPISPPPIPTELELQSITAGPENEELAVLYHGVSKCPCHGHHKDAPHVGRAWEVPQKPGYTGNRVAVVEVET